MKNPIEFSNRRPHEKSQSSGSAASNKKDFAHTSMFDQPVKLNFRNDSGELQKRRSPDVIRNFLEPRGAAASHSQAAMINNLKCELSSLKHEVTKLTTVNTFEPLQFKPRAKLDKVAPVSCQNLNGSADTRIQEYYQQPRTIREEEDHLKRDIQRLKHQYGGEDPEQGSANGSKELPMKLQTLKARKQQEQLREQLEKSKKCRQFKDQAERLREELRMVSEREKSMLEDKKLLLERLNERKNDQLKESYDRKIQQLVETHTTQKSRLETLLLRSSDCDHLRRSNSELERIVEGLHRRIQDMEIQQKQVVEASQDLLRRREKQISILKQQIAILQQLTSTKLAEQNCLQLQKQSVERMCQHKDSENRKLQKDVIDLKERLESERSFSLSINEKLGMKNLMIQSLETDANKLRSQLTTLETIVDNRKNKLMGRVRTVNLQVIMCQDSEKLASKPHILERKRTCTTQTSGVLICSQCTVQQQNQHKQNIIQSQKTKYFDTLFDSRVQKTDRNTFELRNNNNSARVTPRREQDSPNPLAEVNAELEKQLAAIKTELNATYLQLLQVKSENCKLTEKLTHSQNEVSSLANELNNLRTQLSQLSKASINSRDKYQAELASLNQRIDKLQVQVRSLTSINQQLHQQNQQFLAELQNKSQVIAPVQQPQTIPTESQPVAEINHMRNELQLTQRQLHDLKTHAGNLQNHLDNLTKKLRRTQDTLCESNDIIHRMNLHKLAERLQQSGCCD